MRAVRVTLVVAVSIAFAALLGGASDPSPGKVCVASPQQTALQYFRRLSLDLRGDVPSVEELQQVAAAQKIQPELLDQVIDSPELRIVLARYHRDLLWSNVSDQRVSSGVWNLRGNGTTQPMWILSNARSRRYRGVNEACLDEPAQFDAAGKIIAKADPKRPGVAKEGWVKVSPYWAPGTQVKVCAYDAQANLTAPRNKTATYDCSGSAASKSCGCGPNLRWCQSITAGTQAKIMESMTQQLLHFVDQVVSADRPYTEVLLSREAHINGPLSHFLRFQTRTSGRAQLFARAEMTYQVPVVPFAAVDKWVPVTRGELDAGLLTLPAYLAKFQSNRGRANRFYNAFLCRSFEAPSGSIPPGSDTCHGEPNLMKRCGCKFCHMTVEPLAAHWGRWSEAGIVPLVASAFPADRERCSKPDADKDATCKRMYVIEATHPDEKPYLGKLSAYRFATSEMVQSIESGPRPAAQKAIDDGAFAQCVARKLWTWFVGSEPVEQQAELMAKLTQRFKDGGYKLRSLVRDIVQTDEYREGQLINGGSASAGALQR